MILAEFRKLKIRVLDSSGTNLSDDADPTRKLIRQVLGAIAEFDKNVIVLRLAAGRARKRKREGRCEGRKPFGYYEGEPEVLALIRRLRRKPRGKGKRALSYQTIAEELNRRGVPTRVAGRQWHGESVRRIHQRRATTPGS